MALLRLWFFVVYWPPGQLAGVSFEAVLVELLHPGVLGDVPGFGANGLVVTSELHRAHLDFVLVDSGGQAFILAIITVV